jgi:hypothetical protein
MITYNLKTSQIFELSKQLIASKQFKYICPTFSQISLPYEKEAKVKSEICRLLECHITLESWLSTKIQISHDDLYDKYEDEMRELRLRWLDWLIQTHKEKGD